MTRAAAWGLALTLVVACTACAGNDVGESSEVQGEPVPGQSAEDAVPDMAEDLAEVEEDEQQDPLEAETYQLFLFLYEPAVRALFWYYSDPSEDLQVDMEGHAVDEAYHKVGRFSTIAEMKEATEQSFTKAFCEALLYPAFEGGGETNRLPMYKEVNGELYRNIQAGGFGWNYEPTDRYQLAYADDQWRILTVNVSIMSGESEHWYDFIFQNEGGIWKFHHLYGYSPWQEYEAAAGPLLSSPVVAYDWEQISDLEPTFLTSYYIYEFLSDVGNGYSDAVPYSVPATEAVENLSRKFDGITKDMLLEAAEEKIGMEYDAENDAFLYDIVYDRATPLVLDVQEDGGNIVLTSITIGKSGRAVRWSYITAQESEDGLRYLSNRVEDIPEA